MSLIVRPILETERIKTLISAPLLVGALAVGMTQMPDTNAALDTWSAEQPIKAILAYNVQVPNGQEKPTFLLPVDELLGVSQGFHQGHPGVDLMAPLGSKVVSMDDGIVEMVAESPFGYGRHVMIHDNDGSETLYAHLGLMQVEVGEHLSAGNVVGTIGTTGWSTGPHLHFEVHEEGKAVNPMDFIGKTMVMAREQAAKN